ncbi:MAG: protease modulator HflK [Gammaproteobacteria bacterium]
MGWNEPGKDRDPWGGQSDLDEFFARIKRRLNERFGPGDGKDPHPLRPRLWWFAVFVLVLVWALSGVYEVSDGQRAVVLRLGTHAATVGPGVHWRWPWPVDTVQNVNVKESRSITRQATVLTRDGQWVTASLTVKYHITDPYQYLYATTEPTSVLGAGADAVLFDTARTHTLQALEKTSQAPAAATLAQAVSRQLAGVNAGIGIDAASLGRLNPPQAVSDARDQAEQQKKQTAAAAASAQQAAEAVILKAQTRARHVVIQARAESERQVAQAHADVARFLALVPAWKKAPKVTETMLRNDALRAALTAAPKVVVSGSVHAVTLPPSAVTAKPAPAAKTRMRPAPAATAKSPAGALGTTP